VYDNSAAGQSPLAAAPMPLRASSPKSITMPADAQNLTVSGAGPTVGEAVNCADCVSLPAGCARGAAPGVIAVIKITVAVTIRQLFERRPITNFAGLDGGSSCSGICPSTIGTRIPRI
jgi:hypothetical protein